MAKDIQECHNFTSSLVTLLVGQHGRHPACKYLL